MYLMKGDFSFYSQNMLFSLNLESMHICYSGIFNVSW